MRPDPTAVAVRFAKKWKKLPPGWTDESVKKFWKTLGKGTPKHKVWNCIEKMDGHIPNTGAFCGGLADWQMPGWRKKNKKESPEARSDAKTYWKGKIKKKGEKAMDNLAARVVLRYAARIAPPSMMGSAAMLKRQGLTPVDVWFGEVRPHRRPMLEMGEMVQNRRGGLLYFAGVASDGKAILGKTWDEAERLNKQVIEDRKHHSSRAASTNTERYFYKATDGRWYVENEEYEEDWETGEQIEGEMTHYGPFPSFKAAEKYMDQNFANSGGYSTDDRGKARPPRNPVRPRGRWAFNSGPLMLQPDYGHGDAAVPGDQEYRPCQHGGPCQCGGQCGCGKKAAVRKMMAARGIKDLQPNKWYISTEDGDTYGPYPNESKAKSDGKAAFEGSSQYIVAKGGTIKASVLNPRKFGLFSPRELVK